MVDHFGAPALGILLDQNLPADLPVQQHQLPVDRQRSAHLGAADAFLQCVQQHLVVSW